MDFSPIPYPLMLTLLCSVVVDTPSFESLSSGLFPPLNCRRLAQANVYLLVSDWSINGYLWKHGDDQLSCLQCPVYLVSRDSEFLCTRVMLLNIF